MYLCLNVYICKMKMKYFISGAISKYNTSDEQRKVCSDMFYNAEFDLLTLQKASEVFNPMRLTDEFGWDREYNFYMDKCLEALKEVDVVYFLDGWQGSNGARLEYETAKSLNKKIEFQTCMGIWSK